MTRQLQALLHSGHGYGLAGLWLLIVVVAICSPITLMVLAACSKRVRR